MKLHAVFAGLGKSQSVKLEGKIGHRKRILELDLSLPLNQRFSCVV